MKSQLSCRRSYDILRLSSMNSSFFLFIPIWLWTIPINTIFRDEHPFTSYFDVHQGYKVLTHCHILVSFLVNLPSLKSTLVEPNITPNLWCQICPIAAAPLPNGHCRLVVGQVHAAIAQLRRVQGEGFTTEANQALGVEVCPRAEKKVVHSPESARFYTP